MSTLLHPCFKDYSFIDEYDFIDASDKAWALQELRSEWKFKWKPAATAGTSSDPPPTVADPPANSPTATAPAPAPAPEPAPQPIKKQRK
eukprot:6682894-Prymnesium_polylepis.1